MSKTIPAKFRENSFNCPLCGVYSMQFYSDLKRLDWEDKPVDTEAVLSECLKCDGKLLWWKGSIVSPSVTTAPFHHEDMPKEIVKTYEEARQVFEISPTASCALLRLALEKLTVVLGFSKGTLDARIGMMVGAGLSTNVQEALDVVRVIGNQAVHPGQIDLSDDRETAAALFELLNYIVERLITEPAKIGKLFDALPENARKAIASRDALKSLPPPKAQDS
ncbi:DUF4145 domain-containing protein [Sphingopyxis sp. PET50]|uniref:DUF4145 domain-containing protein n=1 Tax=Sphingopyxis sp. PET50 TaxID=2976533 RepID=UPI0021AEFFF5|nr:DUF4145 domain-containing protein [Sphingopyxis sp. PET50]